MGKIAIIKTKQTELSVPDFINSITDEQKRSDCNVILTLMQKAINDKPKMWGSSIIGFGKMIYKSPATGREVEWFKIGFSPRKANLSIHLCGSLQQHADSFKKLGKHKLGAGCLYINKLEDVDVKTLEKIITSTVKGK